MIGCMKPIDLDLEARKPSGAMERPDHPGHLNHPHPEGAEARREQQRLVCGELLERWVPLATSEALSIEKETRGKAVIEDDAFDAGLKAGAFVLKVLERLARLDGLDAAEKREVTLTETADPLELAKRIEQVSPILARRLEEGKSRGPVS